MCAPAPCACPCGGAESAAASGPSPLLSLLAHLQVRQFLNRLLGLRQRDQDLLFSYYAAALDKVGAGKCMGAVGELPPPAPPCLPTPHHAWPRACSTLALHASSNNCSAACPS